MRGKKLTTVKCATTSKKALYCRYPTTATQPQLPYLLPPLNEYSDVNKY